MQYLTILYSIIALHRLSNKCSLDEVSLFLLVSYDEGAINASAEGVNIFTVLHLSKDTDGRLKISNVTCNASIAKMRARFSGTLGYLTHAYDTWFD